jgi:hypothetical protein
MLPELCLWSMEAHCYLIVLTGRMAQVFPDAGVPAVSGDADVSKNIQ